MNKILKLLKQLKQHYEFKSEAMLAYSNKLNYSSHDLFNHVENLLDSILKDQAVIEEYPDIDINFGKYKGKNLKDLCLSLNYSCLSYIGWLLEINSSLNVSDELKLAILNLKNNKRLMERIRLAQEIQSRPSYKRYGYERKSYSNNYAERGSYYIDDDDEMAYIYSIGDLC